MKIKNKLKNHAQLELFEFVLFDLSDKFPNKNSFGYLSL